MKRKAIPLAILNTLAVLVFALSAGSGGVFTLISNGSRGWPAILIGGMCVVYALALLLSAGIATTGLLNNILKKKAQLTGGILSSLFAIMIDAVFHKTPMMGHRNIVATIIFVNALGILHFAASVVATMLWHRDMSSAVED
jgi:hypothetical protein